MSAASEASAITPAPVVCLLCGGTRVVPHFRRAKAVPDDGPPIDPYRITHSQRRLAHAIVRCAGCGFVMLPLEHVPRIAYEEAADPYYVEQAPQRIANAHRLLELVPAGGDLLELGCACGFLLVAARERGFRVQGVEMSAWAAAYARDTHQLDVRTGCLEDLRLPGQAYDVVVMADVIEHLTDPRRTIREVVRVLRPGGRLLILTPDIGSVVARAFGPHWWCVLDDHYFYFSRPALRQFLEAEGLTVEHLAGLGRVFPVSHWVFKLGQYSSTMYDVIARITRAARVDGWQVSINLGDQMACVARKK